MTTTIHLRADRVTASVVLHAATALYDCSALELTSAGSQITRAWPRLSTGEELLWSVLAWLNGQGELPSMDDLAAGLDADNLTAVRKAIAKVGAAA